MVSLTRILAPTGFKSSKPNIKSSKNLSIANGTALTEKMLLVFSEIEDPRVERTGVYLLTDILIIGILSVIAGRKGWEDMENYGLSKYDCLEQFLALPEGIPSADTFRQVFEGINPKVFECDSFSKTGSGTYTGIGRGGGVVEQRALRTCFIKGIALEYKAS
ncbi:Mobile element protein [Richelia intracellularis]|nr:Mobile element protein [Richelia intracellularis]